LEEHYDLKMCACACVCFDACRADAVVLLSTSSTKCGTNSGYIVTFCVKPFFVFVILFYLIKDA